MKSTRRINKLFQEADSDIAILITRTRLLKKLTSILRSQLDDGLAEHCYVANIEQETLVILADTAARASKLRFHTNSLLTVLPSLDRLFSRVKHIKVKILNLPQDIEDPTAQKYQGPSMNQDNAEGIKTLAEHIDDPDLQDALTRLARHAK